jgi:NADPH2:quinone reductase
MLSFGKSVAIIIGNASGKVDSIDIMKLVPKGIRLQRPSLFEYVKTKEDFEAMSKELMELLEKKLINFHIHQAYNLENASESHVDLEGKATIGKLILKI